VTAAAVVAGPQAEPTTVGRLRVAEEHARACWQRLVEHAQGGRCTCHLGVGGSVHVLAGCVTGRMLHEEYWRAAELVRELSPNYTEGPRHGAYGRNSASESGDRDSHQLEAGDFDGRDPESDSPPSTITGDAL